jgi:hypothetical protein
MKSTGGKLLVFQSGMLVNLLEIIFMLTLLSASLVYLGTFFSMHPGLFGELYIQFVV